MKRRGPTAAGLHIESYIPYLVNRAATAMLNFSARQFEKHGLTVPQWRILLTLWQHRECRFGELAKLTSIEPPTLSRLLNGMTKSKWVKRERIEEDTRSVNVSLTAAGAALFEKTIPFAENVNNLYIDGLTAADLAVLRRSLVTIYDNVQRGHDESDG
jgi:MarR family transcriptional regulator, organic hydroperoxide resistance regulator